MRGEHSVSVRFDEIEHAWNIVDTIKTMNFPLHQYEHGSYGPHGDGNLHSKAWYKVASMNIGIIGLGKIGSAVAQRLISAGHEIVGFDLNQTASEQMRYLGVKH